MLISSLPGANPLPSEHKIGIFVSETAIFPWFWPLPSTKLGFLCAFASKFLPDSASASSKPHSAEKRTPVWLAIWRIWAGFANSQHRDAALATPNNIYAHSSLSPHWAAAQTDANLSAHLHRLPTPPPYLRQMRLSPGRDAGVGYGCYLARCIVPANHRAHESLF